jgi:hypothetical protein
MALLQHLKQARARPRRPFPRTAFTVVAALVREHKLDDGFLTRIREDAAQKAEWIWSYEPQPKNLFKPPLFALVAADEFRLIQAILEAVDNPYVPFAHSPDELLASGPLFRLNPDLPPGLLAQAHLRALLAREIVQAELNYKLRHPEDVAADPRVPPAALERLLDRLHKFIDHPTHHSGL